MRFDYPTRVKTGVVLLLLVALYGLDTLLVTVRGYRAQRMAASDETTADWTSVYESRFESLRRDLPPESVVGYVTDQPPGGTGKDLRLAQYALAPVIIRESVKAELVVGNFHDPRRMTQIVREQGLVLVRDYGNGVVLLRGKAE